MPLPRFRIRTLMIAVAVVALELAIVPLAARIGGRDEIESNPGKALAITMICTVGFIACTAMSAAVIRDVTRSSRNK